MKVQNFIHESANLHNPKVLPSSNLLQIFQVHRMILATASPVFEKMFYTQTTEAKTGSVCFFHHPDAVKWVLDNLYTGTTQLPDVSIALKVYKFSQMYQINSVSNICRDVSNLSEMKVTI